MNKNNLIGYRPTWAEINLGHLAYNFYQIKKMIGPKTKMMVTVKADAYGHGLIQVSRKLVSCGVDYLGVASIDEGMRLRKSGIKVPILILGAILKKDISPVFKYRLTTTVCDLALAKAVSRRAAASRRVTPVHIKVDTGMGRIGVWHQEALDLIRQIRKLKSLRIEGLFTHFPLADTDKKFTRYQIDLLNGLVEKLKNEGIDIPLVHSANSMAAIDFKASRLNMVRPGLVIYGLYPKQNLKIRFKPVLSLKTRIVFAKDLAAGCGVSYGHSYITKKKTRIVTLPIGYGDGYPRNLSNHAPVLIRGKRLKICGRICMDQMMVDVKDLPVKVGDEVILIGSQGKNKITTEELARLSGTIPYEIVCGLGCRIPRVFIP